MTNTYKNYFNSQEQLKTASSLLNSKDYESAAAYLKRARESAKHVFNEPVLAANAVQSYTLADLCHYCHQLLITGCQHSRCLGHCLQQLEEHGYAQEQT